MPTVINNQASALYNYNSSSPTRTFSNTVETTVLDLYGISATKHAVQNTFRPGDTLGYMTRIKNIGSGTLYNVSVSDDLANNALVYDELTLKVYLNSELVTPMISSVAPLTFLITNPLVSGDELIITYSARLSATFDQNTLTNTQAISAKGGSVTGQTVNVTPNPTPTLSRQSFAQLQILKAADKTNVMPGESLTYTFTLQNSGNIPATPVVITDRLPMNFAIQTITVVTNGVTTEYSPTDYTIDATTNTLTLPNNTGPVITVPAATQGVSGKTIVTIVGTIS